MCVCVCGGGGREGEEALIRVVCGVMKYSEVVYGGRSSAVQGLSDMEGR